MCCPAPPGTKPTAQWGRLTVGQYWLEVLETLIPKLIICFIAAASTAAVVTIYHCITAGHIRALLRLGPSYRTTFVLRHHHYQPKMPQSSMENSLAELIPSHKYQKGSGLVSESLIVACYQCTDLESFKNVNLKVKQGSIFFLIG